LCCHQKQGMQLAVTGLEAIRKNKVPDSKK
jgi:hypothetical protein